MIICTDADECANKTTCAQVCTNTFGSFECSCYEGFLQNGADCHGKVVIIIHFTLTVMEWICSFWNLGCFYLSYTKPLSFISQLY